MAFIELLLGMVLLFLGIGYGLGVAWLLLLVAFPSMPLVLLWYYYQMRHLHGVALLVEQGVWFRELGVGQAWHGRLFVAI